MKKILLTIGLFLFTFSLWAQSRANEEKTILFLIPFYSKQYDTQAVSQIKDSEELKKIASFQLMGFWNGAQVALEEFNEGNIPLNIIVKDITDSETKLRSILENTTLMSQVDLIIGPFFSKQFTVAAQYAKKYKIPIVNPFTNRSDIVRGNEYVYKLIPSTEMNARTIAYISGLHTNSQIILYADTTKKDKLLESYVSYFKKNNVKYKMVSLHKNIVSALHPTNQNIVVAFTNESAKMMMMSRDLIYSENLENLMLVVPESWLHVATYDIEYYSKLNIHFFSDYYVDENSEQTKLFTYKYIQKYNTPPSLESFAYQGYDVTRYFVSALLNNMDLDRVKVPTIGYHFSFDKEKEGGYENLNTLFLQVKENDIVPAEF